MTCAGRPHIVYSTEVRVRVPTRDPAPVRRDRLERPDLLTVDIDPPHDAFDAAVEVALLVLDVTDDLGLTTLVKTSGGKGLHVVMPIRRHVSPEELRHAATRLTQIVEERRPDLVTASSERQSVAAKSCWIRRGTRSERPWLLRIRRVLVMTQRCRSPFCPTSCDPSIPGTSPS